MYFAKSIDSMFSSGFFLFPKVIVFSIFSAVLVVYSRDSDHSIVGIVISGELSGVLVMVKKGYLCVMR